MRLSNLNCEANQMNLSKPRYRVIVRDGLDEVRPVLVNRVIENVETIKRIMHGKHGMMKQMISFTIPCVSVRFTNRETGRENTLTIVRVY